MTYKNLRKIIDESDHLTREGLQKALHRSHSTVSKILNGKRPIKIDEIPIIEKYIGRPFGPINAIDSTPTLVVKIKVMGIIEHNSWREESNNTTEVMESIPAMPGYNLPGGQQVAYKLASFIDKYSIGDYLICSKHDKLQSFIETGCRVVATRREGQLIETGLYVVSKSEQGKTLLNKLDSNIIYKMNDLNINAIVMGTFSPDYPLPTFGH